MALYIVFENEPDNPLVYITALQKRGPGPAYPAAPSPAEYLLFAGRDVEDGTPRGLINGLGNVKRALHLATDLVLHELGLLVAYRKSPFPDKLKLLGDLGVIEPLSILTNLNVERNTVEHEYAIPDKKRAAEALDVAKLAVPAFARVAQGIRNAAIVGWAQPRRHSLLTLGPEEVRLFRIQAKNQYTRIDGVPCYAGPPGISPGFDREGVRVQAAPWKVIPLTRAKRPHWEPIIKAITLTTPGLG